jgi:hypothetical protein
MGRASFFEALQAVSCLASVHVSCHVNQAIVDKSSFNRIIGAMKLCVGFPD